MLKRSLTHEEERRTDFQDPPRAYLMYSENMVNYMVDGISDNELVRRYNELEEKELWSKSCKKCRKPELIHESVCVEEKRFEDVDILEERDRFFERMKLIKNM